MTVQTHPGAIGPGLVLHVTLSLQDMEAIHKWSSELILAEREACLKDCAGWTTFQRPDVNDGKPWQAQNDPNGYCRAAIKARSAK